MSNTPKAPRLPLTFKYGPDGYAPTWPNDPTPAPFSVFITKRGSLYALPASEAGMFCQDIQTALDALPKDCPHRRRLMRITSAFRNGANISGTAAAQACNLLHSYQRGWL